MPNGTHDNRIIERSYLFMRFCILIPLLILSLLALPEAHLALAQSKNTYGRALCGETRLILVRYLDGQPAAGVRLTLSAATETEEPPLDKAEPTKLLSLSPIPLPTPDTDCLTVNTGTLSAVTDEQGLARFDQVRTGSRLLQFAGDISHDETYGHIVPATIQGRAPYGRARQGGGFIEAVDTLNEESGPGSTPVEPGIDASTSRYILEFSNEYGGWVPGLDLTSGDDTPPIPLAHVTPVSPVTLATEVAPNISSSPASTAQDPALAGSTRTPLPDKAYIGSSAGVESSSPDFLSDRRAILIGLLLGGVAAFVMGKKRERLASSKDSVKQGNVSPGQG